MNTCIEQEKEQALKEQRLFNAFSGVGYNFFADWSDSERLAQELLGEDITNILP